MAAAHAADLARAAHNEMIAGVLLRSLGWPLKLVFTSAAQRHHTWITRWLVNRMDAIIALTTSRRPFSNAKRRSFRTVSIPIATHHQPIARGVCASGLPGRYAIGCFGRVRAQKGSDVFVDAMCRLLPRYPDFTAVMVGAITTEHLLSRTI